MKNFLIVILMIGIVVGTVFGVRYEIELFNKQHQNNNVVEETIEEEIEENIEENTTEEKELDLTKCLNNDNYTYELVDNDMSNIIDNIGVSISYSEDKNSYILIVDWKKASEYYGLKLYDDNLEFDLNTSKEEVKSYEIVSLYQSVGEEVIIFIMNDGTIKYIPIEKALKTSDIKLYDISDLSNVISLSRVQANPKNSEVGSFVTSIAKTKDGSFYLLTPSMFDLD